MIKTLHDLFFELYPEPSTEMDKRLTRLVIREDGWHIEFYSESEDRQGNVIAHHLEFDKPIGSTYWFARAYLIGELLANYEWN